jgi:L-ascorbate metabolism protein UlaG (beta-lactamase superfamily)
VRLTWLSVANFMIDVGGIRILIDGYITRGPQQADFFGGGGGLAFTTHAFTPDEPAIRRVKEVLGDKNIDWVMTSHSHFDHSFDTAVWAKLTGAPVIGSQTTAYQAIAQGVPASQCHVVLGGEVLDLGGGSPAASSARTTAAATPPIPSSTIRWS